MRLSPDDIFRCQKCGHNAFTVGYVPLPRLLRILNTFGVRLTLEVECLGCGATETVKT